MSAKPKRSICILTSTYEGSNSEFADYDPPAIAEKYLADEDVEIVQVKKQTASIQVRDLVKSGKYDVFLNLCDGAFDEDRAGVGVVQALERYNAPYTGADLTFYEPTKDEQKMLCVYYDIGTAPYAVCSTLEDVELAAASLRYPVITKHVSGYSSVQMTRASRCVDAAGLIAEAMRFIGLFGCVLVEEFIEGPEFTCLVCESPTGGEPVSYPAVQCAFPPGETFKHFDLKWITYDGMEWTRVEDPELDARLQDMSRRMFKACRGVSYGRCDIRMDARTGELYMLEINPQCGIFLPETSYGSADYVLSFAGNKFRAMIDDMIAAALRRHAAKQPIARVTRLPGGGGGFGLVAQRDIAPGEVVSALEGQAHNLVSRSWAMENYSALERQWFRNYAYPVAADVFAVWSSEPRDWRPINHSCDPNCWLHGLNTVARRRIRKGEQLTMDYATFCNEEMEAFECKCGTGNCRKTVRGDDYKLPALQKAYDGHFSPFLTKK